MPATAISRRWFVVFFLAGLALILYLRLIPFHFLWDGHVPVERIRWQPLSIFDVPFNLLIFIPLGFGLAGILARRDPAGATSMAIGRRVFLAGILLSTILEITQIFMPDREPSLADIVANGIGVLLGYALYRAWEMGFGRALNRYVTLRNLLIGLTLYGLGVALLTIYLNRSVGLSNWEPSFPLIVGNEATGNRPWAGQVEGLAFETPLDGTLDFSAEYDFSGQSPFENRVGSPSLAWAEGPISPQPGPGVMVGPGEWLMSAEAFDDFSEAARRSSIFTIRTHFVTANPSQFGPARVVSISAGPFERNVTIGQQEDDLIVRLRTTASSVNGEKPGFLVPGVFSDGQLRQLVVEYDRPKLSITVDEQLYTIKLAPGLAFFVAFNPRGQWTLSLAGNPYRYDFAYWASLAALGIVLFGGPAALRKLTASRERRTRHGPGTT